MKIVKLVKAEKFNITGRGTVLALSMSENGIDVINIGDVVEWDDMVYSVTGVEGMRKLNGLGDNVGLLVSKWSPDVKTQVPGTPEHFLELPENEAYGHYDTNKEGIYYAQEELCILLRKFAKHTGLPVMAGQVKAGNAPGVETIPLTAPEIRTFMDDVYKGTGWSDTSYKIIEFIGDDPNAGT